MNNLRHVQFQWSVRLGGPLLSLPQVAHHAEQQRHCEHALRVPLWHVSPASQISASGQLTQPETRPLDVHNRQLRHPEICVDICMFRTRTSFSRSLWAGMIRM